MNSNTTPQLGVLDALTAGLTAALKRPWLIAIPAIVDLALWLFPRLAVDKLVQQFLVVWEAFFRLGAGANQAVSADMIVAVREGMTQIGQSVNLAEAVTGSWLAMPSAVAALQTSRLMLVSNDILAPMGISVPLRSLAPAPWQPAAIEIHSFWGALLIVVGLWLVGQFILALFLSLAALHPIDAPAQDQPASAAAAVRHGVGLRGLALLTLRLIAYTLLLMALVFALYIPLSMAMLVVASSGSAATGLLFAATGGMTLWLLMWLLTSMFFVSEALVLEDLSLWQSLKRSFGLVRRNTLRTTGLVLVINIILLGFRAVWGLVGQTSIGAALAVVANAYLTTAMLLAVYIYYVASCRQAQAGAATSQKPPTHRG